MNCANHPDRERAAFCQNCGKPVCSECVRNAGSSIFCEPCLVARVASSAPPAGYGYTGAGGYPPPVAAGYPPAGSPVATSEPSPGLAALLGFIPGVGAMYNGQYAKGIVHLIVFAVLVSLASDVNGIFGLFIAGWICYMVIEAHHTACARRDGTPLPNPFGLNDLSERLGFGKAWPGGAPNAAASPAAASPEPAAQPMGGAAATTSQEPNAPGSYAPPAPPYTPPYATPYAPPYSYPYDPPVPPVAPVPPLAEVGVPYYRRFPSGAIWLIGLGLIFLVGDNGFFHIFHHPVFWPVLLIGGGVWVFVHQMICSGHGLENDGSAYYQWRFARAMRYSFWLILTGILWLFDVLGILSWSRSWPLFLIAAGVVLLFKRTLYGGRGYVLGGHGPGSSRPGSASPSPPVPGSEAVPNEPSHDPSGSDSGNGNHDDLEGR
jgi:TM2 domain-containing membrane protein YozV